MRSGVVSHRTKLEYADEVKGRKYLGLGENMITFELYS